jgi:hypothetical protein
VLGGQQEYAEQLGALLWPQLAAAYIAAKLKPIQPQSDAEVGWQAGGWAGSGGWWTTAERCDQCSSPARCSLFACVPAARLSSNRCPPPNLPAVLLQVEQYSRKSALGAKLEQKAVKLHLLPGVLSPPMLNAQMCRVLPQMHIAAVPSHLNG